MTVTVPSAGDTASAPGPVPWRRRAFVDFWIGVWLLFLLHPLSVAWGARGPARAAALAAVYMLAFTHRRRPLVGDALPGGLALGLGYAAMAVLIAVAVPAAGDAAMDMVPYVAVVAMFTFEPGPAWVVCLGLAAGVLVLDCTVAGWSRDPGGGLSVLLASAAVFGLRMGARRNSELMRARVALAERAVDDERARMTRDLHHILGHSLTVITVKSELVGRLLEVDPGRAAAEVADIERLARGALADVRATIAGTTRVTLASELANARGALEAGGVEAQMPTAVDDVPPDTSELFGWVVREGVTNVLRHSRAQRCVVVADPGRIEVHDDGAGDRGAPHGQGLTGLAQRAQAAGFRMRVGRSPSLGGVLLTVERMEP